MLRRVTWSSARPDYVSCKERVYNAAHSAGKCFPLPPPDLGDCKSGIQWRHVDGLRGATEQAALPCLSITQSFFYLTVMVMT